MRKSILRAIVLLGVLLLTSTSALAAGGDEWTLDENSGAIRNTWIDIQSIPTLPPGAINPATGSPFTTAEEISGLRDARNAGGWGVPALNALGALTIGGSAIYTAYELGDYFRSKISGDTGATVTGFTPTWSSYYGGGVVGENGSSTGASTTSSSWSLTNFGGWGATPQGGEGVGFGVCSNGCWILNGAQWFCANGTITANCTGAGSTSDNNVAANAAVASIISHNASLTNESLNTSAGSLDCKAIGACMIVWRTFTQMDTVVHQETCNTTCYNAANTKKANFIPNSTNGGLAQNQTAADIQCGGFLGTATGTADQAACRAALNYLVNPSCTSGCTGTSTPTVTIPGTITVSPSFVPFVIPEPQSTETYSDYLERLREKGYVGTVTVSTVITDSTFTGPQGVVSVEDTTAALGPDSITAWPDNPFKLPAPDDAITLQVNSPAAPDIAPVAGVCSTCAIDWTPIESLDVGTKFPFGVPTWVSGFFGGVTFADSCPSLDIGKPSALGGGTISIPFCSTEWETTYRPIIFPILEALMTLAAITFLGSRIFGIGGGESE